MINQTQKSIAAAVQTNRFFFDVNEVNLEAIKELTERNKKTEVPKPPRAPKISESR